MSTSNHNPHPDFQKLQASRPKPSNRAFTYTQTASPQWSFGSGPNTPSSQKHIPIDPHDPHRSPIQNYKLLISAIAPRPIAFLSTLSVDKTPNLAPFSYFNLMSHDPPIFVIGFASPIAKAKDSLKNILDTKEAVINIISETFIEAANATSIDAPPVVSEWDVSGLTRVESELVKPARVKEAVFSIEARLESVREWESRRSGEKTGTMVVLEGVRFWAREDGINADRSLIDPTVLRPVGRLGGITYSRTIEGFELTRPRFEEDLGGQAGLDKIKEGK